MSEEWTGIKISEILGKNQISWRRLRNLALAINASMERATAEAVKEAILNDVGAEGSEYIKKLEHQLAAAQQQILNREARWEETEKLYKYSLDQLAAAQAAMAEVEEHNIRGAIHPDVLARHIKPLVDALEQIVNNELNDDNCASVELAGKRCANIARAALAQMKEGNPI